VDHDRAVVHGSMVDHGRRRPKSSLEHGLRGRSDEWKLTGGGGKGRGSLRGGGVLPWVRVGGVVPEGRPVTGM
jgi:hypothetical protein